MGSVEPSASLVSKVAFHVLFFLLSFLTMKIITLIFEVKNSSGSKECLKVRLHVNFMGHGKVSGVQIY